MTRAVDRTAHGSDVAGDAGRRLALQDQHRLDGVILVGRELGLELRRIGRMTPVAGNQIDIDAVALRQVAPQRRELSGLEGEHLVAGRQRVEDRRLPGAGAGRRKDRNRTGAFENALQPRDDRLADRRKFRTAVVDERLVHRA